MVRRLSVSTKTLISLLKLSIPEADVDTSANAKSEPITLQETFHNFLTWWNVDFSVTHLLGRVNSWIWSRTSCGCRGSWCTFRKTCLHHMPVVLTYPTVDISGLALRSDLPNNVTSVTPRRILFLYANSRQMTRFMACKTSALHNVDLQFVRSNVWDPLRILNNHISEVHKREGSRDLIRSNQIRQLPIVYSFDDLLHEVQSVVSGQTYSRTIGFAECVL